MSWQRSSFCLIGACIEILIGTTNVLVRRSEDPGTVLSFSPEERRNFIAGVKNGEFDL